MGFAIWKHWHSMKYNNSIVYLPYKKMHSREVAAGEVDDIKSVSSVK